MLAAVRNPSTGQVFTGPTHADAYCHSDYGRIEEMDREQLQTYFNNEGFLADDGRFLTREECFQNNGFCCSEDMDQTFPA